MSKKPAVPESKAAGAGGEATRDQHKALDRREELVADRETAMRGREDAATLREEAQRTVAVEQFDAEQRNLDVREANAHLVLATLAAQQLKDAALLTQRRQDEFLAMLAHELRNPLAPIRNAVALLARQDTSNPTLTLIRDVIQRQVEHMARLLDDLLDASRLTSGKVNLQRQPTQVEGFVDQAVEICRGLIDRQHQLLTLDLPATPLYVDGDPVRLAQVVGNLLHNAAKYTHEGGLISVSARAVGDTVVIRVGDNGAGISKGALQHIFDMFYQEDKSLSRSQGGLGIGLTVVRRMVELHGGTVDAQSAGVGLGSEFSVTLPLLERPRQVVIPEQEDVTSPPARILVVDDNVDASVLLAMLLRLSKHQVEVALNGTHAIEQFARQSPQVVLCDIGLTGMDGYEVAARIRQRNDGRETVLVALTGYDGPDHRARALAAGFDHHVAKPVDFEALLLLIDQALAKLRSE